MILLHFLKWQGRLGMRGSLQLASRALLSFFFNPLSLYFLCSSSLSDWFKLAVVVLDTRKM